jgi:hypothetical protein
MHGRNKKYIQNLSQKNRDHLGDLGTDVRTIFKKQGVEWTELAPDRVQWWFCEHY